MSDIPPPEKAEPDACVLCASGRGYLIGGGKRARRAHHFGQNSIGYKIRSLEKGMSEVFFPGESAIYAVSDADIRKFDPTQTGKPPKGKEHARYICNVCFILKPSKEFDINQRDSKGRPTRRPSCIACRSRMDLKKIPPREERRWKKERPRKGSLFQCPLCQKHSIAFVNAKIVLDHDHVHGKIRGFLCDSCNTGLGRFKNGVNLLQNAMDYVQEFD